VNEKNVEVWEVYQAARMDEMGITVSSILSLCREFGVKDPEECILKIREIVGECHKVRNRNKDTKGEGALKGVLNG
jgi:hypothetical protein